MTADVDWLDDEPEPDEGFRVTDEGGAGWCVRLWARSKDSIETIKRSEKAEIARIRDRARSVREGHESTIARMREYLTDYLDAEGVRKIELADGTVGLAKGQESIVADDESAFIEWALENEPTLVRTKHEIDRTADRWKTLQVAPDGAVFDGMGSGEVVPGVRVVTGSASVRLTLPKVKPDIASDGSIVGGAA